MEPDGFTSLVATMMTAGLIALGLEMQARVLAAVRAFDAFTEENDPSWRSHAAVRP